MFFNVSYTLGRILWEIMERGKKRYLRYSFIRALLNSFVSKRENELVVGNTPPENEGEEATSGWFYIFIFICVGVAMVAVTRSQTGSKKVSYGSAIAPHHRSMSHMEKINISNEHRRYLYGENTRIRNRPSYTRKRPRTRSQTSHRAETQSKPNHELIQNPVENSVENSIENSIIKNPIRNPIGNRDEFKIISNDGAGDCLFHCWVQILQSIGIKSTVRELRCIVSDSITKEKFDFLFDLFTNAKKNRDRSLLADYGFMSNVTCVTDLKDVVKTSAYFGDDMALRALEAEYPIHCIVLEASGNKVEKMERFKVDEEKEKWFAILSLENVHYELVQYNGAVVMKKQDLPVRLQEGL